MTVTFDNASMIRGSLARHLVWIKEGTTRTLTIDGTEAGSIQRLPHAYVSHVVGVGNVIHPKTRRGFSAAIQRLLDAPESA